MQGEINVNSEHPTRLIAVYGTLRKGHGNWAYLLEGQAEMLGTYQTEPEYTMFTNGGFPVVTHTGNTSITYEVYKIDNYAVLSRIHRLEGCTGVPGHPSNWYDLQPLETPHGQAFMYIQNEEPDLDIVESGDWNNQ